MNPCKLPRKNVCLLDCLQSAFSLKIRLVFISSSAIPNHDVMYILQRRDEKRRSLIFSSRAFIRPRFSQLAAWPLASLGFACSNRFAKKNKRLLAVYLSTGSHSFPSLSSGFFHPFPKQRALPPFPCPHYLPLGQLGNGIILAGACGHV